MILFKSRGVVAPIIFNINITEIFDFFWNFLLRGFREM